MQISPNLYIHVQSMLTTLTMNLSLSHTHTCSCTHTHGEGWRSYNLNAMSLMHKIWRNKMNTVKLYFVNLQDTKRKSYKGWAKESEYEGREPVKVKHRCRERVCQWKQRKTSQLRTYAVGACPDHQPNLQPSNTTREWRSFLSREKAKVCKAEKKHPYAVTN